MKWRIEKMFNLNELCVMAYENAAKREAKDGKVSTDTMQMLKHTATEVVEATEAYNDFEYVDKSQTKVVFASELADIVCCVLIIAGKENIDMEYALTACMEKNYKRAIGEGDK
jgi:NTP pyrophosphatase (non-canonical NTP hydrolase)